MTAFPATSLAPKRMIFAPGAAAAQEPRRSGRYKVLWHMAFRVDAGNYGSADKSILPDFWLRLPDFLSGSGKDLSLYHIPSASTGLMASSSELRDSAKKPGSLRGFSLDISANSGIMIHAQSFGRAFAQDARVKGAWMDWLRRRCSCALELSRFVLFWRL